MKITYYQNEKGEDVFRKEFLENLEKKDYAKVKREMDLLKEHELRLPGVAVPKGGYVNLWYLKVSYRTNEYRLFFCQYENEFVMLHGFQKKTQRIPSKEIEKANRRKRKLLQD